MNDSTIEERQVELEHRRLDLEIQEAKFERRRRLVELRERRKDRDLKRFEIEREGGQGLRFSPAQAVVAGAILTLLGGIIGSLLQSVTETNLARQEFESTLILRAVEAEDRKVQIQNLKFFLSAGFISDPYEKISEIEEDDYPSLPRATTVSLSAKQAAIVDSWARGEIELPDGTFTDSQIDIRASQWEHGNGPHIDRGQRDTEFSDRVRSLKSN